jgi:hypothetical protein
MNDASRATVALTRYKYGWMKISFLLGGEIQSGAISTDTGGNHLAIQLEKRTSKRAAAGEKVMRRPG